MIDVSGIILQMAGTILCGLLRADQRFHEAED
jgi:hypothetical protein